MRPFERTTTHPGTNYMGACSMSWAMRFPHSAWTRNVVSSDRRGLHVSQLSFGHTGCYSRIVGRPATVLGERR